MPSKTLMAVWAFFDFAMLAAGGVAIAMSIIWRAPDVLREIVISDMDLTAGLVLGIAYVLTFVISVGGVVQRNHVTRGLVILNWALIIDGMFTVVIGCMVWFWTLRERVNFQGVWAELSNERRQALQDKLSCCGYMDPKDMLVNAGFCADPTFASTQPGCVDPITSFADSTLRSIFTTIFGYMAIVMALFLATLCVINKRIERERFRKIDAKRGGRGFV